ncbi:MAG: acyltransferase family protein [Candidatus Limnocylindrales bacterium]
MTETQSKSYFRPDIEGLRAIAIGAVLLYHAGVAGAEGGFIGVDVFFVISGFLITGLLVREWNGSGRIDLLVFYARRFRRLLPAALLAIVATVVASYFILSELRFPGVAQDGAAAALYVSNIRFASEAIDYLGAETAPSPLLHFWSLGVEEQFYLFWPLIIFLSLRLLRLARLWIVVSLMVVASFALALYWTDIAAPWAFFSLPTRAWQLGAGALIAIGVLKLPRQTPGWLAQATSWAGLAAIGFGVVYIKGDMPYPGTVGLIPVIGTALAIVGMSHTPGLPARLLSTRFPRWIGRISYSLYLWHWPLLVLVPIALGIESVPFNLLLVVVATLVAWASTELYEAPIRHNALLPMRPSRSVVAAVSASVIVAGGALAWGAAVQGERWMPGDVDRAMVRSIELPEPVREGPVPEDLVPPLAGAYWDLPDGYDDDCHLDFPETDMPACIYGDPQGDTTVLLLGDSHAQQWLPAVQALADERGWRLRAITKSACPMADGTVWNSVLRRSYRECDQWREAAYGLIEAEDPAFVLVAADGRYQLTDPDGNRLEEGHDEAWEAALTASLRRIGAAAPAIVIADTPRVGYDPAECLATAAGIEGCEVDRERMVDEAYAELEATAAEAAGAGLISATDWICFEEDCPLVRGSTLVYRDSHHLTATFADRLSERLGAAIDAARGIDR